MNTHLLQKEELAYRGHEVSLAAVTSRIETFTSVLIQPQSSAV